MRILTAGAWKEISMAYVRREILATMPLTSLFIKFTNFISRACADYYADEVYKPRRKFPASFFRRHRG
ncbi:hypothetical protein CAMGR0001_2166 [Campylobacter gracilis RM3268]|uniref:Uncharacterized protein n=1 Tax=Campylobacter gracilis RM3268 TaxID=553220 RepID=C8PGX8_9BACT|nr:hypothetical protein CAMGR0001_2166 [Campylobacter gracilis RM3268]